MVVALAFGYIVEPFEELGWTGFAIPQRPKRHGITAAGHFVPSLALQSVLTGSAQLVYVFAWAAALWAAVALVA